MPYCFVSEMLSLSRTFAKGFVLLMVHCFICTATVEDDEANCGPQNVHLAYGDSLKEMVVMWATLMPCTTELEYGTSPWHLNQHIYGTSIVFTEQNAGGLQNLHRVKIQDLNPMTTYYYRVVSNNIGKGPFYFQTAPAGSNWPAEFLMFGDLGIHTQTIPSLNEEALKGEYTALIHIGDFAYDLRSEDGRVGNKFFELIEPVAAFLPYMTAPGNHEIDSDTFAHYRHRFSMPGSEWPIPVNKTWYSFNVGPIHFVSYSSEVFFTLQGENIPVQKAWLIDDLRKANQEREERPWIIAFGHRPMYCSSSDGDDCTKNDSLVRAGLEDLFYSSGVDLVLQAHEHNYERLYPMLKGRVLSYNYTNPTAPIQIVSGAAGSREGPDNFLPVQPVWSAFRMSGKAFNSYGRLKVINATHLYWEQRSIVNHTLIDSLWVVQEHHGMFGNADMLSSHVTANTTNKVPDIIKQDFPFQTQQVAEDSLRVKRLTIGLFLAGLSILMIGSVLVIIFKRRHNTSFQNNKFSWAHGQHPYISVHDDSDDDLEFSQKNLAVERK